MSIQVTWTNPTQSVLRYQFPRQWDWNDFEHALEVGFNQIESVSHSVTAVFDLTQAQNVPDGAMIYWRKMMRVLPANQKELVFITTSFSVQTAIQLFLDINKRYRDFVRIVESLPDDLVAVNATNKTILIVEDEDVLREEIVELMELEGYRVLEANNGLSAVKIAQTYLPDLIVSDVSMPHLDGFQLIETLRKKPETAHLPVIMLTARADRNFMRHGMELGADDYITKPFSGKELTNSVQSRLRRIEAMRPS